MEKICGKCGRVIGEDDFLCPHCGSIWGDVQAAPDGEEKQETPAAQEQLPEPEAVPQELPPNKMRPRRWMIAVSACFVLAFLLALVGPEMGLWAGEGTTAPSTPGPSTSRPQVEGATVYTVTFVDPFGEPIEDVGIVNLRTELWSSTLAPKYIYSDSNGTASFTLYDALFIEPYVRIVSVPEGYHSNMVDTLVFYPEGKTHMQLVLIPLRDNGDETPPPATEPPLTEPPATEPIATEPIATEPDVDPVPPGTDYPITMEDTTWLYEPFPAYAAPGSTVQIKLRYEQDACIMLFANGEEPPNPVLIFLSGPGSYLQYEFTMPGQEVELKVRTYHFENGNEAAMAFFQTWYRQNPSAPDTSYVDYFGHYGPEGAFPVVRMEITQDAAVEMESVAGYDFWYYFGDRIQVLASGEILSLRTAYEQGVLSEEDIRQIYQLYMDRYFPDVYGSVLHSDP